MSSQQKSSSPGKGGRLLALRPAGGWEEVEQLNIKESMMQFRASDFAKGLSHHGYGFQYAVVSKLYDLMSTRQMDYRDITTELATIFNGKETRIDILLQVKYMSHTQFVVVECKRVNPKYGYWCFAKSPRSFPDYTNDQMAIESVRIQNEDAIGHNVETRGDKFSTNCYHVSFVLQSKTENGDVQPVTNDRDAIEMACGQVCLGAVGLSQAMINRKYLLVNNIKAFYVIPVIVTTAKLYTTTAGLDKTDISNGVISLNEDEVAEKPWIIYQYMLSPGRTINENRLYERSNDVVDNMYGDSARSIAIINADHLGAFWKWYDRKP